MARYREMAIALLKWWAVKVALPPDIGQRRHRSESGGCDVARCLETVLVIPQWRSVKCAATPDAGQPRSHPKSGKRNAARCRSAVPSLHSRGWLKAPRHPIIGYFTPPPGVKVNIEELGVARCR